MATIRVTVEMTVSGMSDKDARDHARSIVEGRGLNVVSSSIKRLPEEGREFTPKPGHPGRMLIRDGREWQIWAQAPMSLGYKGNAVWVVPGDRRPDDATIYLTDLAYPEYGMKPHTGDGKRIKAQKPTAAAG